jgi:hypothetical protein
LSVWIATALAFASSVGKSLKFRDPAPVNFVANCQLAGFIIDFDDDVLRKSLSDISAPRPEPKFHTLFAHFSNSVSWVTPCSMGDGFILYPPGDLWLVLRPPPSRCSTISVVRFRALTLLTPATGIVLPSEDAKFEFCTDRNIVH